MRPHLCVVAALCAALCSGCFVFEELDQGERLLEQHGGSGAGAGASAAQPEDGVETDGAPAPSLDARLRGWWQQARSLHPAERSSDIVRCAVARGEEFTSHADCLARGGRPIVSGP